MNKYLNKFFCMISAAIASYAVNMMYKMNSAFAVTYNCGSSIYTDYNNNTCQSGNWWYPGSRCGSNSDWKSFCRAVDIWGSTIDGWTCTGTVANSTYGYCDCWNVATSYITAVTSAVQCGTHYICRSSAGNPERVVAIECNTGPNNAGYESYSLDSNKQRHNFCACCPSGSDLTAAGNGFSVYANVGAQSATGCYVVGELKDTSGLYKYTNTDKCYYDF